MRSKTSRPLFLNACQGTKKRIEHILLGPAPPEIISGVDFVVPELAVAATEQSLGGAAQRKLLHTFWSLSPCRLCSWVCGCHSSCGCSCNNRGCTEWCSHGHVHQHHRFDRTRVHKPSFSLAVPLCEKR